MAGGKSTFPPGLRFVVPLIPKLVLPPLCIVAFDKVLEHGFSIVLPFWAFLLSFIFSTPLAFTLSVQYAEYIKKRDAKRLGAVLPPRIKSTWPGGLDLIRGLKGDKEGHMLGGLFPRMLCVKSSSII